MYKTQFKGILNMARPAVFLDRDGTLIEEVNYLKNINDLKLFKDTPAAIRKLNKNKILAILVSNQSGVARGYFDEENVKMLNNALNNYLKQKNAFLDGFYFCPHHTKGVIDKYTKDCDCRKPKPGMIEKAVRDFGDIDLKKSYVIGDKICDVELAKNAGCKGVLIKTGYGSQILLENKNFNLADYIADSLTDAVDWILRDLEG